MRAPVIVGLICLVALVSGCVSLSEYNRKVAEVDGLKGEKSLLEDKLKLSELASASLETQLQQHKEKLTRLQELHEELKTRHLALTSTIPADKTAVGEQRKSFGNDLESLTARVAADEARIKELLAELTVQQEAAKKVAPLEAAVAEGDTKIKSMIESMRGQEARIEQLKGEVAELSRKRTVSDEKEQAVVAVRKDLQREIGKGEVVVSESRDRMIVMLPEKVLFDSGSASLTSGGKKVLDRMVQILKKVKNNQVRVEGHTDSAPIGPKVAGKYPTNWDLAAARATTVVKYLQGKGKIEPKLLALAGYGPYQPTASNDTPDGRKLNRRIEIALVPLEPNRPEPAKK